MFHWPHGSVLGIDVSDRTIEALLLKRRFGRPSLASYGRGQLPAGIVEDGRILKPAALVEHLRTVLKLAKPGPIRERWCVIALPESQVFSHVFTLPAALSAEQVRHAILLEAEHYLPVPLRESDYDFFVLGKSGETQEVYFAATRRGIVHQYLAAFRSAALLPMVFEPESASLCRALTRGGFGERASFVLLVDVGSRTTNAHLVRRGNVVGSLTIPLAGDHFTQAVAAAIGLETAAAEAKKIAVGFGERGNGRVMAALSQVTEPIVSELRRYLAYAQTYRGLPVARVVLCGGSALLPGFPEYLQANLGVPVQVGNPLPRVRLRAGLLPERHGVLYANVVGLSLRGAGRNPAVNGINLLAQAYGRLRSEQVRRFFSAPRVDRGLLGLISAFAASLAVLAGLVWYRYFLPQPSRRPPPVLPEIEGNRLPAPREVRVMFAYGDQAELPAGAHRARLLEATVAARDSFGATGTTTLAVTDGVTQVRLINLTDAAVTLVARTRLLAADGTVLRLAQAANLPAAGDAVAAAAVPAGATVAEGKLLLPGLPEHLRSGVYGELTFARGQPTVAAIAEQDVAAARQTLRGSLWRQAAERFVEQLAVGEVLLPIPLPRGEESFAAAAPVGTAVPRFEASAEQRLGGLAVNRDEIAGIITTQFGAMERPLTAVSFSLARENLERRQISVMITTPVPAVEK